MKDDNNTVYPKVYEYTFKYYSWARPQGSKTISAITSNEAQALKEVGVLLSFSIYPDAEDSIETLELASKVRIDDLQPL